MRKLLLVFFAGLFVDCRLVGSNICVDQGNKTRCCYGYFERDSVCLECPRGTFGTNCQLCANGTYGTGCSNKCNCGENEVCHPARGCQKKKINISAEKVPTGFAFISQHVSTAQMVTIGLLLVITTLCLVRIIAGLRDRREKVRPPSFLEDFTFNRQSSYVDRTTVYTDDPLENSVGLRQIMSTGTAAMNQASSSNSELHYGNCGIENFTPRKEFTSVTLTPIPNYTRPEYGNCGIENFSSSKLQ